MQALHTAATGMQAAMLNIEVIANNLANQGTTAFNRQRAEFKDLFYVDKQSPGTRTSDTGTIGPSGIAIGLGVGIGTVYSINEQGPMEQTGSDFDVAINGKGFFRISRPDGTEAFTRAGSFQTNGDGEIVTVDGYTVSPGITIPQNVTNIDINASGEVIVTIAGQTTPSTVGQLELVRFLNEAGLKSIGNNLLTITEASGVATDGIPNADGFGAIVQGWLEGSNVQAVTELTNMIKVQRAYEMCIKVMQAADEGLQALNDMA